jgi:hypothetical protein
MARQTSSGNEVLVSTCDLAAVDLIHLAFRYPNLKSDASIIGVRRHQGWWAMWGRNEALVKTDRW